MPSSLLATLIVLGACALLLTAGCGSLGGTLREALSLVEEVRPEVSLGEVEVAVWSSRDTVEEWHRESSETLSFPSVHRILEAQRHHFVRFGLESALDILIAQRLAADAPQLPAFVVPGSPSTIVARRRAAQSLHTMTHELGHIASWRSGAWEHPGPFLWLDRNRVGDPHWIDLDAFIAGWAVEEGAAELTSIAAMQLTKAESDRSDPLELAQLSGANALNPGVLGPLVIRTQQFAYGNGLRFVCVRGGAEGLTLSERLDAAWAGFRGTSREILFPSEPSRPSRLAIALRDDLDSLEPKPTAATRWGAFLLFEVLSEASGYEVKPFLPIIRGYRDDLLLSFEGDRHLWITEWESAAVAEEFAVRIGAVLPDATIGRLGLRIAVSFGGPTEAAQWWLRSVR